MRKATAKAGPRVFLSLGSNLGARRNSISDALRRLEDSSITVCRCSSAYETEPLASDVRQPFINITCEVITQLDPSSLLETCESVERAMGRLRKGDNGPRIIDIDILFLGQQIVQLPGLCVPHPRLAGRRFVLVPLSEIAPEFRDPLTGMTVRSLLERCSDRSSVRRVGDPADY